MDKYIINQPPNMQMKILTKDKIKELSHQILTLKELKDIINTMTYQTRFSLMQYHHLDLIEEPLTGFCLEATDRLCCAYGNDFDIMPYKVQQTFTPHMYHSFAVGRFDTVEGLKRYIIDLTYRQFCLTQEYEKELDYGLIGPGHFFYNKKLLKKLLKDGYLEVTKDSLVTYGESFSIAGQVFYNSCRKSFITPQLIHYTYEEYNETLETGKMITKKR